MLFLHLIQDTQDILFTHIMQRCRHQIMNRAVRVHNAYIRVRIAWSCQTATIYFIRLKLIVSLAANPRVSFYLLLVGLQNFERVPCCCAAASRPIVQVSVRYENGATKKTVPVADRNKIAAAV